jgi:hypothetical protein
MRPDINNAVVTDWIQTVRTAIGREYLLTEQGKNVEYRLQQKTLLNATLKMVSDSTLPPDHRESYLRRASDKVIALLIELRGMRRVLGP